jgi:flagellar biosynthesis protein FliQ
LVAGPVLLAGMVVGLIVGLIQALTQIQEQTVAFVPKLVAMIAVLGITLPWVLTMLVEYATTLISEIPRFM